MQPNFNDLTVLSQFRSLDLDCEQSPIFLCKVTARVSSRLNSLIVIIVTSWFAIALDEIRTRRILREKAD